MFVYLCIQDGELPDIRRHGLPLTAPVRARFHTDLSAAKNQCGGKVLVLPEDHLDRLATAGSNEPPVIAAEAFENLAPFQSPEPIEAAGGYVVRKGPSEMELLLIFRRGKWDLPKGKRDAGETLEECALREVREELGISRIQLIAPLGTTTHGYSERGAFWIKTTYWYCMHTPETQFVPQSDEKIEEVAWMPFDEARRRIDYETLRNHMSQVWPTILRLQE